MRTDSELQTLVTGAVFGDRGALGELLGALHPPVYNLALRMLRYPQFADDAAQEVLVKLVTHLGSFRRESAVTTWVFRIAANHLLTARKKALGTSSLSFEAIAEQLETSLEHYQPSPEGRVEDESLVEEVKRGCTLGMLAALSERGRMALILGEIYEFSGDEAAYVMGTSPQAYRQQLSRARAELVGFMRRRCGLVNPENPCRCHKHVANKVRAGRLGPDNLRYRGEPDERGRQAALEAQRADLTEHRRAAVLLRSHPVYEGDKAYLDEVRRLFAERSGLNLSVHQKVTARAPPVSSGPRVRRSARQSRR